MSHDGNVGSSIDGDFPLKIVYNDSDERFYTFQRIRLGMDMEYAFYLCLTAGNVAGNTQGSEISSPIRLLVCKSE